MRSAPIQKKHPPHRAGNDLATYSIGSFTDLSVVTMHITLKAKTNEAQKKTLSARRGFALVVTLSLMILLTIIAVGLLTLSSVSLRTTGQG